MRNQTVDIAKGLGILTVVICHNWILYHDRGEFSRVIFSFHMPLFFFISGIFFKPLQSFKETAVSKLNSLLKPYALVVVLLILFDYVHSLINGSQLNVIKLLLRGLYGSIGTLSLDGSSSALGWVPIWFLNHLFAIYIFAWILYGSVLKRFSSKTGVAVLLLVIFFIGTKFVDFFWYEDFNPLGINGFLYGNAPKLIGLPLSMDLLLVTTPIFLAGYYLSQRILSLRFNPLLLFLNLLIFFFLHYYFDLTMGLHDRQYDDFLITTVQMCTGLYCVFGLSSYLSHFRSIGRVLAYLGSASLFILIFHYSVQHHITGIFQYHFPEFSYLIACTAFALSIVYSLFIYEIANKVALFKRIFYNTYKNFKDSIFG